MGQREILKLLNRDEWLSARDLVKKVPFSRASVDVSLRKIKNYHLMYGVAFERRKRGTLFFKKK